MHRSKAVQTRWLHKSVRTSPFKVSTTSRFTSPFKIEQCCLQPSKSGVIKAVKQNIFLEDEKSDSDISFIGSGNLSPFIAISSSKGSDSDSDVTNEKIQ